MAVKTLYTPLISAFIFELIIIIIGRPGRPSFNVNHALLQRLWNIQFTVSEMASLLGVSPRTVSRRLAALNMRVRSRYSRISDHHLDQMVYELQNEHPNTGYRIMRGMLAARGFHIQERRIRESMIRVDPVGVSLRWATSVHRRSYRVQCPNALWHLDGNHALIRWKMVIHGGIDGYSRLIVYLKCSSNNRADTVFNLFVTACNNLGIPSRVRSDQGGENVLVAMFMTLYHGVGRGSHIAGTSVHNQRVERLWRDVYMSCTSLFYHLFYSLEDCGLLDPDNEIHLYALHYVYLPRINQSLQLFWESWNQHTLTSCNCMTPQQLWMRGLLQNIHSGYTAIEDCFSSLHTLPTLANVGSISGIENIEIRAISISLTDQQLQDLHAVQPLRNSDSWGVDIYLETVSLLEDILS